MRKRSKKEEQEEFDIMADRLLRRMLKRGMTVAELRQALEKADDNLLVIVDGAFDHGYNTARWAREETVEDFGSEIKEYWDDENLSGGQIQRMFVVGIS